MHIPTLITVTLLVNLVIGFYLYVLYRRRPKDTCFLLWSYSCFSFVIGGVCASLRGVDFPVFITYFVADLLLISAPVMVFLGLVRFSRFRFTKSKRKRGVWLFGACVVALFLSQNSPLISGLIAAFAVAYTFWLCAQLLKKSVLKEPLYTGLLRSIFILHSAVMLIQALFYYLTKDQLHINNMPETTIYTLLSHLLLTTFTALLLPWLSFLKLERRLTLKSQRDGLTMLSNREYFFNQVEQVWANNNKTPIVVMMIDIDHFKSVNDQHGHGTGDIVLKGVASILSKGLRASDLLGRIGGEEFAAVLSRIDMATAQKVGDRLRQQISEQMYLVGDKKIQLTVSIGVVIAVPGQHTSMKAFKAADDALYQSKNSGRNILTIGTL